MPVHKGRVYEHPEDGPIYVTDGAFEIGGRVSNYFSWRRICKDGSLGSEDRHGYAGDWPEITDARVVIRVVLP